jgi:hypothetical protein
LLLLLLFCVDLTQIEEEKWVLKFSDPHWESRYIFILKKCRLMCRKNFHIHFLARGNKLGTQAALLGKFSKNNNRQLLSFFLLDDDWGSVLQEAVQNLL